MMNVFIARFGRPATMASRQLLASVMVVALAIPALLPAKSYAQEAQGAAQAATVGGILGDSGYTAQNAKVKGSMNFDNCLNFKIGFCMCGLLPGIKFTYRQPTSQIEVVPGNNHDSLSGAGGLTKALFAGPKAMETSHARRNLKVGEGQYSSQYDEARVHHITPISRYASSASFMQATQSLICDGLTFSGLAGMAMGQMLNPATWMSSIQGMFTSLGNAIQSGIAGLANGISGLASGLANLPQMVAGGFSSLANGLGGAFTGLTQQFAGGAGVLQNLGGAVSGQLSGLADGSLSLSNINPMQIAQVGGALLSMGSAASEAGTMGGDDDLANAGIGFTESGNAANALAQGAKNGTLTDAEAAELAKSVQSGLQNGLAGAMNAQDDATASLKFADFGAAPGVTEAPALTAKDLYRKPTPFNRWAVDVSEEGVEPRNSATQQVFLQNNRMWSKGFDWMNAALVGKTENLVKAESLSAAELCMQDYDLKQLTSELASAQSTMADVQTPPKFLQPATYLNANLRQVAPADVANASCPLTHAGFVATGEGEKVSILNCHSVCTPAAGGQQACRIVPLKGFGGSCFGNALSKEQVNAEGALTSPNLGTATRPPEGLYPACNGHIPAEVADGNGGSITQTARYDAKLDHLSRINANIAKRYLLKVKDKQQGFALISEAFNSVIKARGGACDALGNPVGAWGKEAELRRPAANQYAQTVEKVTITDAYVVPGSAQHAKITEYLNGREMFDNYQKSFAEMEKVNAMYREQALEKLKQQQAELKKKGEEFAEKYKAAQEKQELADAEKELLMDERFGYGDNNGVTTKAAMAMQAAILSTKGQTAIRAIIAGQMAKATPVIPEPQLVMSSAPEGAIEERFGGAIIQPVASIMANPTVAIGMGTTCAIEGGAQGVGITGTPAVSSLLMNKNLFVGCWGNALPVTGYNQGDWVGQGVVAERFNRLAVVAGAVKDASDKDPEIKKNNGLAMFNKDYPPNYDNSEVGNAMFPVGSGGGGGFKGSKCYPTGTPDKRVWNRGEKILPGTEILGDTMKNLNPLSKAEYGQGNLVMTKWAGTSCCICPGGIKKYYQPEYAKF